MNPNPPLKYMAPPADTVSTQLRVWKESGGHVEKHHSSAQMVICLLMSSSMVDTRDLDHDSVKLGMLWHKLTQEPGL